MFVPPRCPNPDCSHHLDPQGRFFVCRGQYVAACRPEPQLRFFCKGCRKGFSRQTFRHDYRDRKPNPNELVFMLLCSGVGLRQIARVTELDIHTVQDKKRKLARTLHKLHHNLCWQLPAGRTYVLDEEETYEGASIRPLTMPVLVDAEHWFILATGVGPIRRLARVGSARRRAQEEDERKRGRRPDESKVVTEAVLRTLAALTPTGELTLRSDRKTTYAALTKKVFGARCRHETTSSRQRRDPYNPLFVVNTTIAMTRDNCGRLRRKSWLVTKKAAKLVEHLAVFQVYRNFVRRRFNYDEEDGTPAKHLGLLPRNLRVGEALAWRQDWESRSIHPMSSCGSRTVREPMSA